MNKYLVLIKNHISMVTAYQYELYFQWIYRIFYTAVLFYIWNLSAGSVEESNKLIGYYALMILLIDILATTRAAKEMSKAIQDGSFSNFLVKPINFPITQLLKLVTILLARTLTPLIVLIVTAFVMPEKFAPKDFESFIGFLVFLILGFILYQSFFMIIGALSFWIQEIGFTLSVIDLMLNLVKGAWIPMFLFSDSLKEFLNYTPIPYIGGYIVQVFQEGLPNDYLKSILIILFWITLFILIFKVVYKKGVERYEANGG